MGAIGGFSIELAVNPRLTWTDKFALFRTDGDVKPLIRQEEEAVSMSAIAEGSEEEFKNNRHLYGVKAIRNVGLGYWQHAVLHTFS
jgi:phage major head subunit gpT-like protein